MSSQNILLSCSWPLSWTSLPRMPLHESAVSSSCCCVIQPKTLLAAPGPLESCASGTASLSLFFTMQQNHAEAHLWDLLPPDIIKPILQRLPFRDAWKCRTLNSCWASVVRASFPVELVIPVKRQNLAAKIRRLQRTASQSSTTLPHYTFKLAGLVSVTNCSSLLTSLVKQGHNEVPCQVLIQLLPPEPDSLPKTLQRLAVVAATALLASRNIKGVSGRVCAHAHGLAGTRTWGQLESKHPLGLLVAVAILVINIACLSSRPGPAPAQRWTCGDAYP
ncbi:hypothetical protein ABBQ32_007131 [Trebouxia sp. C0010 RCD-2024]